jgi:CARDB protein
VHRLRPTRTHLLLGLVVVLLATVPVLIPLMWTGATGPEGLQLAASPGVAASPAVPALPRADTASPTATVAAPPPAGELRSASPTPDPTPSPTTPPATSAAPPVPPPSGPAPTTGSASPEPADSPAVLAAGPDLVVVSVSWTPDPVAGSPVVFAAVVRNTGTDPTPAVTHGIAFSVDGTKVTWSANSSEPLGPGQERTYSADGGDAGNTWTATGGTHTVLVQADDLDRIPETSETDNTATTSLTIP